MTEIETLMRETIENFCFSEKDPDDKFRQRVLVMIGTLELPGVYEEFLFKKYKVDLKKYKNVDKKPEIANLLNHISLIELLLLKASDGFEKDSHVNAMPFLEMIKQIPISEPKRLKSIEPTINFLKKMIEEWSSKPGMKIDQKLLNAFFVMQLRLAEVNSYDLARESAIARSWPASMITQFSQTVAAAMAFVKPDEDNSKDQQKNQGKRKRP